MKIGFEAKKAVSNFTGIGNYSRRCINALKDFGPEDVESVLFIPGKTKADAHQNIHKGIKLIMPGRWIRSSGFLRELWRCFFSWYTVRREGIDIYHGLSNELPFFINFAGCKTVVTIHDLIFIRCPDTYDWLSRVILRIKTYYACHIADHIIAVSERTKQDIIEFYGINENKITVVYQSIDDTFRLRLSHGRVEDYHKLMNLPGKYILCVGTIQKRKNQQAIVEALTLLPEETHAVLAGKYTRYQEEITATAKNCGVSHRLHILNGLPNKYLPAVYQYATVFVLPSIFEGFGIPVVEALASGVPVVAARGSCLEEAGGQYSIYVDPYDTKGMANAILQICNNQDLRDTMVRKGKDHSLLFTDKHLAKGLLNVYNKVMNMKYEIRKEKQ